MAQKNFSRWKSLQEEVLSRFSELKLLDDLPADDLPAEHHKA